MSDPVSEVGPILARIPSGIFILTARNEDGHETGLLASWVQQAAFDPPAFTVAVNKKRYLNDWLASSPHLAISIVAESQKNLVGHFGRGFEPSAEAFEGLDVQRTPGGLPILADSVGWMEGEVTSSADAGDHLVYVVRMTGGGMGLRFDSEKPWVHLRKSGLNY